MLRFTTPMKPSQAPPVLLRWWPIIAFVLTWSLGAAAGYYTLSQTVAESKVHITALELELGAHSTRQRDERAELLAEIRDLRGDVKLLLLRLPARK